MKILNYIGARLLEPSTWLAVAIGCSAVAHALQSNATLLAALLAGLGAMALPERKV